MPQNPEEDEETAKKKPGWHISRTIQLGTIVSFFAAIFVQSMTAVWFASKMDSRIGYLEVAVADGARKNREQDDLEQALAQKLGRIEERQSATLEILRRIKTFIDNGRRPGAP